jgi:hypothetical protein
VSIDVVVLEREPVRFLANASVLAVPALLVASDPHQRVKLFQVIAFLAWEPLSERWNGRGGMPCIPTASLLLRVSEAKDAASAMSTPGRRRHPGLAGATELIVLDRRLRWRWRSPCFRCAGVSFRGDDRNRTGVDGFAARSAR